MLKGMFAEPALNDILLFEVPTRDAQEFLAEVSASRLAWLEGGDEIVVIGVLLNPGKADLAALLQTVRAWVAKQGLLAIRFELDGRSYALPGAAANVPAAV